LDRSTTTWILNWKPDFDTLKYKACFYVSSSLGNNTLSVVQVDFKSKMLRSVPNSYLFIFPYSLNLTLQRKEFQILNFHESNTAKIQKKQTVALSHIIGVDWVEREVSPMYYFFQAVFLEKTSQRNLGEGKFTLKLKIQVSFPRL